MWRLNPPSDDLKCEILEIFHPVLIKRINKYFPALNNIFDTQSISLSSDMERLKQDKRFQELKDPKAVLIMLLIGRPVESKKLSDSLMSRIYASKKATGDEQKESAVREDLKKVFNYDYLIAGKPENAFEIVQRQESATCPYCNRSYIYTIQKNKNKKTDKPYVVRPALDHWFDKGQNPLLALNIYNLIPSCTCCNSSVKHSKAFDLATHIHPYENTIAPSFKFRLDIKNRLEVIVDDTACSAQEKNMIKDFALREIYATHSDKEALDLVNWMRRNPPGYVESILDEMCGGTSMSYEEVFRMVFSIEYLEDHHLKRPLSKLKRDILEYLGFKYS